MKSLILLSALIISPIISTQSFASEKSICGGVDDRVLSNENPVGRSARTGQVAGCTVTMISKSCALSVGHCVDAMDFIQFNVPLSINTEPTMSDIKDIYLRNKDFMRYADNGRGDDWAVIKLEKNQLTGMYPGEAQGFYEFDQTTKIRKGMKIRITGFGIDSEDKEGHLAQQTHSDKILKVGGFFQRKSKFGYGVDTMGGNSGSAVVLKDTNKIIGVHSHGGCDGADRMNSGTLISEHKSFQFAIQQCLDLERRDL